MTAAMESDHASPAITAGLPASGAELADWAQALIHTRQNVAPRRLVAPAPSDDELTRLFEAAAAAPDHGQILPWRFVIVPVARRADLGEAFAAALLERDLAATPEQMADAREKAGRAPLLMLVVARLGPADPDIPMLERMVAIGAAIQNLQLQAHAMGYGCGLTSGRALTATPLRRLFNLLDNEQAVCFINVGTVSRRKPLRPRPSPRDFVTELA